MTEFTIAIVIYLIGLALAECLYRYGEFNQDHDVVWGSWVGVFVILWSLGNRY